VVKMDINWWLGLDLPEEWEGLDLSEDSGYCVDKSAGGMSSTLRNEVGVRWGHSGCCQGQPFAAEAAGWGRTLGMSDAVFQPGEEELVEGTSEKNIETNLASCLGKIEGGEPSMGLVLITGDQDKCSPTKTARDYALTCTLSSKQA
jgi:hypothetical protein